MRRLQARYGLTFTSPIPMRHGSVGDVSGGDGEFQRAGFSREFSF